MAKKQDLSDSIASAVEAVGGSVVGVSHGCERQSGFVVDAGAVLASARFVNGHDSMRVHLDDGAAIDARVVGRDPVSDVALLESDAIAAPPLRLDAGKDVKVGHLAVALGRPGRSVRASLRMIGALADEVRLAGGGVLERYLETDRALPSGFSGGPLVDTRGRVLGMSSRAVIRGADLAVTKATIDRVVRELREHGGVARGFLGVGVYPIRLPRALREELSRERGALVVALQDDGPAARAGILEGDILLEVAGTAVTGPRALRRVLYDRGGHDVDIAIARGGARETITVTVEARR